MSFSYSADPSTSEIDEVRFLLGDTTAPGLLSDEEIGYYVTKLSGTFSDQSMTAAFCADAIAAKYAGEVSISADGVTYSGEQLQDKYNKLAVSLRSTYAQLQGIGAEPYAGGTTCGQTLPPGVKPLNFGIGMTDNARAGSQKYGNWNEWISDWDEPDTIGGYGP